METNIQVVIEFKDALKKEHAIDLTNESAVLALQNLTDFFSLLYQYDLEDKQKDKRANQTNQLI